jgi:hypothetical protein
MPYIVDRTFECFGSAAASRGRHAIFGLLIVGLLAACADDPAPTAPLIEDPAAASFAEGSDASHVIIEPEAFNRFSMSVTTAGAFKPGVPVQIVVRTTAHLDSPETALRVVVPELDAHVTHVSPQGRASPPTRKPTRDQWTAGIAAGGTNNHVTSVVFPRPGIYHVVVEASHPVDPTTIMAHGRPVQHAAIEVVELEVAERGIRARPARGPMVMEAIQPASCIEPMSEPIRPCEPPPPYDPPPPSSVVWVWTAIWYSGPGMDTFDPVRRARVSYSGSGVPSGQSTTDNGGYVLLPCNLNNGLTNITVTLDGADVRMTATHTSVSTTLDMRPQCYGGGWVAWYNWSEARTWDNLLKVIDGSRGRFGFSRAKVNARVGGKASCGSSSCYLTGSDEIVIHPDNVWHAWGEFTAAHEYGHAVHARTSAGMSSCGGAHSWSDTRQDRCLAHNEGFASYIAFAARGSNALQPYYDQHANDNWRTICPGTGNCETRVTSFLLDLSESNVDPYGYGIHLPARNVFDMTGQCWLTFITYDLEYQYTTSRWSQSRRNDLREVWDCLEKQYPQHRGTRMDANGRWVDTILENISHPWAPLSEPVRSKVLGRLGR